MTTRERFHACMNYQPVEHVPNHEVGNWVQTKLRWRDEGLPVDDLHWDWFVGEERWGLDPREYFDVRFDMVPPYVEKVLSREGETEVIQRPNGVVSPVAGGDRVVEHCVHPVLVAGQVQQFGGQRAGVVARGHGAGHVQLGRRR